MQMIEVLGFGMAAWCAAALVLAVILMLVTVNYEQPGWSTVVLAASIAALHYGKAIDVTQSGHYLGGILTWTGIYIAIGIAWSVLRWKVHVDVWSRNLRQDIQEFRRSFMQQNGLKGDTIPECKKSEWKSYLSEQTRQSYSSKKRYSTHRFSTSSDIEALRVIDHVGQVVRRCRHRTVPPGHVQPSRRESSEGTRKVAGRFRSPCNSGRSEGTISVWNHSR